MRYAEIFTVALCTAYLAMGCNKSEPSDSVDAQLLMEAIEDMRNAQGASTTVDAGNDVARRIAEDNSLVLLDLKMAKSEIDLGMDALTSLHIADERLDKPLREALSNLRSDLFAASEAVRTSYNAEAGLTHSTKPLTEPTVLIEHHQSAITVSNQARTKVDDLIPSIDDSVKDEVTRTMLQLTLSRCQTGLSTLEATLSGRINVLRLASPATAEANAAQSSAIAAIERAGGKIDYGDESTKAKVIGVQFESNVSNGVMQYVARLPDIQRLGFFRASQITDEAMVPIGQLRQLRMLLMFATGVTDRGLEALAPLEHLETLILSGCAITDNGLQTIGTFKTLSDLDLSGTRVTAAGLPYLRGLTNLEALNLAGAALDDRSLTYLGDMIEMKRLDLSSTSATREQLDDLATLITLKEQQLSGQTLSAAEQERLSALEAAQSALEQRPRIGDGALVHLQQMAQLEQLSLSGTRVSDAGLDVIMKFEKLTFIDLKDTEVTDAGREKLRQALPKAYIR